ncbi:ArgE/DapE family deacylase [Periweissella fabalis]|uniref:Probable succinyl-diaminopimelate desuccinylase n=1 Tax=Periweissella fabalis TaxID=1070421 RepID=A0A7X6N1M3_9LACO|nr:ArgE/DapE family deacylase [Periweissella fabalis]MCM0598527.1 ArgE/DapE family deacylase [Periweissella fabalis]NKZ24191.1 ArgE/DapE family deacylase [Periweissella fabalis]
MHEAVSFLQKIIQIPSTNDREEQIALLIKDKLTEHGIPSKIIKYAPNRSNLIAEIGPTTADKVLGLTGHLDVVLPGSLSDWKYPPFAGEIHDNKLYGRGAADMKSGVTAMLYAFIGLANKHVPLRGRVRLILTIGEENGAQGAQQLTTLHYADDLSGLIVGEPTDAKIVYAHKGSFNYTVTAKGRQAHSSIPELGINAISGLINFVNAEVTLFDDAPIDDILGPLTHTITIFHSGEQINNVPADAYLRGNIRPTPSFDNQAVTNRLKQIVNQLNKKHKVQLTLTIDNSFVPVKTNKNAKLINIAKTVVTNNFHQPAELSVFTGATDASEFTLAPNSFETILLGPGPFNIAHQADEYVDLNQFEAMITIYQQISRDFLL